MGEHVVTVAIVQNEVDATWRAGDPRGWSWAVGVGSVGPIVSGSGCETADAALAVALDGYAGGSSEDRVRVLYDPFVYRIPDDAAARGIEGVEFPMTRHRIFEASRDAEIMGDALAKGKPKQLRKLRGLLEPDAEQRIVDRLEVDQTAQLDRLFRVLSDVAAERRRQRDRWGEQLEHPDLVWSAILGEEVGEATQAALHDTFGGKAAGTLYAEVVQVAAVAVAWLEALHARGAAPLPGEDAFAALREATDALRDAALAHHGDETLEADAKAAELRLKVLERKATT